MALDLAILGSDGAPAEVVSMRADVHERLISAARASNALLLLRIGDFYADADYALAELPLLLAEVDIVARAADSDAELSAVLGEVRGVAEKACRAGCGIVVIAD